MTPLGNDINRLLFGEPRKSQSDVKNDLFHFCAFGQFFAATDTAMFRFTEAKWATKFFCS